MYSFEPTTQRRASALIVFGFAVMTGLACGSDSEDASPVSLTREGFVTLAVTVRLATDVPTFKVDGRLQAFFELGGPFLGESPVGTVVLPAGARMTTQSVSVPDLTGTLHLRELTLTPAVPFLCGLASGVEPRFQQSVTITLFLCQP